MLYIMDDPVIDTLYIATTNQLLSPNTDAKCMLVAYDDPVVAVHQHQLHTRSPQCTLTAVRYCANFKRQNGDRNGSIPSHAKYIYIGRGVALEILQKITLSPVNYLQDWVDMNRLINYSL